ncbi:RNB domain-containing ribonuclease [Nocardioides houyundeii]|uniref:RNB domain-containing ribonuclease n=1 Tax=Nocardioides houyundeii TaxID=2045452 RepID=UPI000C791CCD|nr:RNB domain-containing ribonuclease [Nocardioides houyundeii]
MPTPRVVRFRRPEDEVAARELREGIAAIQAELGVSPEFDEEVLRVAEAAAAAPRLPALDRTDIPFLSIDPPGAMDLDQVLHIERRGSGYRVHYAIADLAAFITPGDAVDREANRRGETLYGADSKIPLHPPVISEGAGSLLPDQVRPALLWTLTLDETGEGTDVTVERARVRSRARYDYDQAQELIDSGQAQESLALLAEVGPLRLAREAARGGVSLPLPDQQIDMSGTSWKLEFRQLLPVESWNAQLSLLTGIAAASLMVQGQVGLLRTLPPADPRDVARLRRTAQGLGLEWPSEVAYSDFVRTLDPAEPRHAAMVVACTRLFRGSGYAGFHGEVPAQPGHAAIAADYAHVTAPLRRLVDRYASEICLALCAGEEVPSWVLSKLEEVPDTMRESGRRANQYQNAILNLMEAEVLADRVGNSFDAVVVEVDEKDPRRGEVNLVDLAIEAKVSSERELPLGAKVSVRLTEADPATRRVGFTLD